MKKLALTLLLLLMAGLAASPVSAQVIVSGAGRINGGPNLPAACSPTDADSGHVMFWLTTSTPGLYTCTAPNVWTIVGGGGGSTSTSTQLLTGGGVAWAGGLNFVVSTASYLIGGSAYVSPQTAVTLGTADNTFARIDVIAVDSTGAVVVLAGTPSATPVAPSVDPTTQIQLTFVTIPANSATPGSVVTTNIYLENTEWATATASPSIFNFVSTVNPYAGTKDIEATGAAGGASFTLTKPAAGTENLQNYNNLVFYLRSKAQWPAGFSLYVFWLNGTTRVGTVPVIKDGAFGFQSGQTTSYQQIVIPTSAFQTGSGSVTKLEMQAIGPNGKSIGFYVDNVFLQSGVSVSNLAAGNMTFRGAWNSTVSYQPNDLVTSGGVGWVALAANTGVTPVEGANWTALGSSGAVTSVFTRTGAVVAAANDYNFNQLAGSIALAQTPATTRGDLLTVNSTPALGRLAIGGANTVLHGGTDLSYSAVVEADMTLAANTTNNVSTSKHGFTPVLPNDATKFLDGTGAFSTPAGGLSGSGTAGFLAQFATSTSLANAGTSNSTLDYNITSANLYSFLDAVYIRDLGHSHNPLLQVYTENSKSGLWLTGNYAHATTSPVTAKIDEWIGSGDTTANALYCIGFGYGAGSNAILFSTVNVPAAICYKNIHNASYGSGSMSLWTRNVTTDTAPTAGLTLNEDGSVSIPGSLATTNCSNAASPAVCGASWSGVVAVPTGTNPTLTINTTKVTATSQIFLQIDESATIAATTCNTTLSTLVQPVVTARTAATSFTIQIGAVIAANPACVSFFIVN